MNKFYIFIFIIFLYILPIVLSKTNYIDDFLDDIDIKHEISLKKYLKKYLKNKNLLESDKIIEPEYMKKIFIEVMLEGAPFDEIDDQTKEIYLELANIFIEKYYENKKDIRGKDIYNLINIKEISQKFYELNGEIPIYDNDYEDLLDDFDDDDDDDKNDDDDFYDEGL